CMQDLHFPLTF
nr:immunoglobulin light chain junction region [Macaca mulatta]